MILKFFSRSTKFRQVLAVNGNEVQSHCATGITRHGFDNKISADERFGSVSITRVGYFALVTHSQLIASCC